MLSDFIEIKDGILINADNIDAIIESNKDGKKICKVYIAGVSYPSSMTKVELMRRINYKGARQGKSVQQQALDILKQQSNFAG